MNPAQVHLALNIFPPALNIAVLFVFALALIWKSPAAMRVALALAVLSALIAIPVYLTGEPAEHLVRDLDGVNRAAMHTHEDAAEYAFIALCVQGVLALAALILYGKRDVPKWAAIVSMLVVLFATTTVFRTAYLGGKIKHPETQMGP
jgi:hypothetical protein